MRIATMAARIILGLIFFVLGGLNGIFGFIPMPAPPVDAGAYLGGLMSAPYFFPLLKGTELIGGALLITGVFTPVAMLILAPVIINITLFHLFLAPAGIPLAILMVALEVFLAYAYRDLFKALFVIKMTEEVTTDEKDAEVKHAA